MSQIMEYAAGSMCACIALYARGTKAPGLTAATISCFTAIYIVEKIQKNYNEQEALQKKSIEVVSNILAMIAGGIFSHYAIRGLCPQLSIKGALIVTSLGVALGLPALFIKPELFFNHGVRTGLVLTAASGLKALGFINGI